MKNPFTKNKRLAAPSQKQILRHPQKNRCQSRKRR